MDEHTQDVARNQPNINVLAANLPQNISIKDIGVRILRDAGLTQAQTAQVIDRTRDRVNQIVRKLPKGYDLMSIKSIRLASQAHKKILDVFLGHQANESPIEIKGADVTKAIDRVYDRVQPTRGSESSNTAITFIQVNLDSSR